MANQIVLAWTVDVTNTSLGPAGAAAALGAVPLYVDPTTDPVLGQNFGLTVASDVSAAAGPSTATRTLTLNMNAVNTPTAPPPFPCRPRTSTPPVLPYPLREAVTLAGSFFVVNGQLAGTPIPTTASQIPSLSIGDSIQFLSQQGVFYAVATVGASSITLTAAYTGVSGNTGAFKEIPAPVTIPAIAAIYSSSDLDTAGVATVPAIPAGPGAQTIAMTYTDSTGALAQTATATLTGRRPAAIAFTSGDGIITAIENIVIATSGAFTNSIGEITLVELSSALPPIPSNATPFDFQQLTDEAQLLISRHLAYLPPSYFALAQQGAGSPQLAGDFILTTGSTNVPTTVDQTAVLAAGNVIRFAEQDRDNRQLPVDVLYTIAAVGPKSLTLSRPFTGIDTNNTGTNQEGTNANAGTMGNIGAEVQKKPSGAFRVSPSAAAPPTNAQLAGPLGQFVDPGNVAPPATMTPPVTVGGAVPFLSDFFTQTLQLALAGVPITPQPITFL